GRVGRESAGPRRVGASWGSRSGQECRGAWGRRRVWRRRVEKVEARRWTCSAEKRRASKERSRRQRDGSRRAESLRAKGSEQQEAESREAESVGEREKEAGQTTSSNWSGKNLRVCGTFSVSQTK